MTFLNIDILAANITEFLDGSDLLKYRLVSKDFHDATDLFFTKYDQANKVDDVKNILLYIIAISKIRQDIDINKEKQDVLFLDKLPKDLLDALGGLKAAYKIPLMPENANGALTINSIVKSIDFIKGSLMLWIAMHNINGENCFDVITYNIDKKELDGINISPTKNILISSIVVNDFRFFNVNEKKALDKATEKPIYGNVYSCTLIALKMLISSGYLPYLSGRSVNGEVIQDKSFTLGFKK